MFNLENSIKSWKRKLRSSPAFEDGDIAELEVHLREEIERLKLNGISEKEAFHRAAENIGEPESIGDELYKSRATQKAGPVPPWKQSSWVNSLLPNYLKTAFRNISRNKGYTFINVSGLAIGLAAFLFIVLFIRNELSYDKFHSKADRIYRVTYKVESQDKDEHYAVAVPGLAPAMNDMFPEVRKTVRISLPQDLTITVEDQYFTEDHYFHTDSTFFEVFDFKLTKGNPTTALSGPNKVVLTGEMAQKLFGDREPTGKTVIAVYGEGYEEKLEVTGVVEDVPEASHFKFQMLVSFETLQDLYPVVNDQNWWMRTAYTYVVLPESHNAGQFEHKLSQIVQSYMQDMEERSGSSYSFELQPLTDIHLQSSLLQELESNGNLRLLYIFGSIAVLILLIACINFMNLATARAANRSKEVGVRKTLGTNRWQLVRQFYLESMVVTLLAGLLALLIMQISSPLYNQLAANEAGLEALFTPEMILIWAVIIGIVTIAAGSYPAMVLSSFESKEALTGIVKKGVADIIIRKGLVIFQFAVSAVLLIGLMVIQNQLDFVMTKDLGFEKEQILVIPVNNSVRDRYNSETVAQELSEHTGIRQVAHASHIPTRILSNNTMVIPEGTSNNQAMSITSVIISPTLKETIDLELKAGRDFSFEVAGDSSAFIVNEAAVDYFGWEEPIGKSIISPDSGEEIGKVIGVFENFHIKSLYQNIEPVLFRTTPVNRYKYAVIRLESSSVSPAIEYSENVWEELLPGAPFEYFFLDEQYQKLYQKEKKAGKLIAVGSMLAIFIACLGLFGLAAHSAGQRTKEIGIRKVLGASVANLMILLSKDMIKLVAIGFAIAIPVAYIMMESWLRQFAYRTNISSIEFLFGGIILFAVAMIAVSSQSVRAALMNPVKSLRSE